MQLLPGINNIDLSEAIPVITNTAVMKKRRLVNRINSHERMARNKKRRIIEVRMTFMLRLNLSGKILWNIIRNGSKSVKTNTSGKTIGAHPDTRFTMISIHPTISLLYGWLRCPVENLLVHNKICDLPRNYGNMQRSFLKFNKNFQNYQNYLTMTVKQDESIKSLKQL